MVSLLERFWGVPPRDLQHSQTLFYEVIPSAQVELPAGKRSYAARAELTNTVLREVAMSIVTAASIDPRETRSQIGPGGYECKVNPAIQCHTAIDEAGADRLAAAFGWVLRQSSVLVADLGEARGATGYAIVDLGDDPLTSEHAEAFFLHAARTAAGLGEGFTAFGNEMLFLNLRDPATGQPYSRLRDDAFVAALEQSAQDFGRGARVQGTGFADARLVENDWERAADGEQYMERLTSGVDLGLLAKLRARHSTLVVG